MGPFVVIARNSPGSCALDPNSFVGRLHKEDKWDNHEYCLLEHALYEVATQLPHSQKTQYQVFSIFSHLFLLFSAHFDPRDQCRFDLQEDEVDELRDRIQMVFEGFFYGVMPNPSSLSGFRLVNPRLFQQDSQMSQDLDRQPIEETARLAISDFVDTEGPFEVLWHTCNWREDDLLVMVRLKEPVAGAATVLEAFRKRFAEKMDSVLPPAGRYFHDFMVVAECGGKQVLACVEH